MTLPYRSGLLAIFKFQFVEQLRFRENKNATALAVTLWVTWD